MSFDGDCNRFKYWRNGVSIPLEQGNVFRLHVLQYFINSFLSQSLWNRAMSFDLEKIYKVTQFTMSQSLWNRAMSFDNSKKMRLWGIIMSQSLWNRAMSFDIILRLHLDHVISCLNPFGTGQCLSTQGTFNKKRFSPVSIPLEQGNVFRLRLRTNITQKTCLNPFGTGQCLSTVLRKKNRSVWRVSIPLEQGNVFRLILVITV